MVSVTAPPDVAADLVLQSARGDDIATRVDIFEDIYLVFLVLGTLVGVVVVSYMLHKAYKYRAGAGHDYDIDRPELGELPTGADKGGRKLFLSFGISAIIVISLVSWTYAWLLVVETGAAEVQEDDIEVGVVGNEFSWTFEYWDDQRLAQDDLDEAVDDLGQQSVADALGEAEGDPDTSVDEAIAAQYRASDLDGADDVTARDVSVGNLSQQGTLRVPQDRTIHLRVTAWDVWHNFGIPQFRVKADAIPGETTRTWFEADETGQFQAECFELCGSQHSQMKANVVVESNEDFEEWYAGETVAVDDAIQQLEDGTYVDEEAADDEASDDEAADDEASDDEGETAAAPTAGGAA